MKRDRAKTALLVLAGLLFLEAAVLAGGAAFLTVELLTQRPDSYASAIALIVLVALGAVGLTLIGAGTLKGRPWIRGATLVWQLLQLAIALASVQGLAPRPDIAWALVIPSVAVIVLLFTKPVLAATTRETR